MKLYLAPGACSLADHIALHEAGLEFDRIKVNLKAGKTEDGQDYAKINPKGYVPALAFDEGGLLTENVAILSWIADQAPTLAPTGEMARYRLLETLAYISTEIHKGFKPFFAGGSEAEKTKAGEAIARRLALLAERMQGDYLFGADFTVADAYLFVMLRWAQMNGIEIPQRLRALAERVKQRPAVQLALRHEGLS
ncbi:MAG: glutathione S-transferase C-terminal domain-containing protein [Caulobacteraceae bacterium]